MPGWNIGRSRIGEEVAIIGEGFPSSLAAPKGRQLGQSASAGREAPSQHELECLGAVARLKLTFLGAGFRPLWRHVSLGNKRH